MGCLYAWVFPWNSIYTTVLHVGQNTIGCLYGDIWGNGWMYLWGEMMRVRVFTSMSRVWHMRGYLRWLQSGTCLARRIYQSCFACQLKALVFVTHHNCSALCGNIRGGTSPTCYCRSTYVSDTMNWAPQLMKKAVLLSGLVDCKSRQVLGCCIVVSCILRHRKLKSAM